MLNKIIQLILSFLEFLKLSSDKILLGLLIFGLSLSVYFNIKLSEEKITIINEIRDECAIEKNKLIKEKELLTINYEKEKYFLLKEYLKKTDSIFVLVEKKIENIKKQQELINKHEKN